MHSRKVFEPSRKHTQDKKISFLQHMVTDTDSHEALDIRRRKKNSSVSKSERFDEQII